MAETYTKLPDGTLEITAIMVKVVSTMSKEEITGKIAEAQTKIDHLNIDLAAAESEKAAWAAKLAVVSVVSKV